MALVHEDELAGKDLERIYIAGTSREARSVERVLGARDVEYTIEPEPFARPFLSFLGPTMGVAFYVLSGQAEFLRGVLREAGLKTGVVEAGG